MFTDDQIRVARNLLDIGRRYEALDSVPRLLHLCVPHQESSWNDQALGDNGHSAGPYQIYDVAHPRITHEVAMDPGFDYAFWEIHTAWRDVWTQWAIDWPHARAAIRIDWLYNHAHEMQGSDGWTQLEAQTAYTDSVAMLEILS